MSKLDITLLVTPKMITTTQGNEKKAFTGHIGTHFDVMNKVFPLDYTERDAIVFDVSAKSQGETTPDDFDLSLIREGMFVAFRSGFIESEGYGSAVVSSGDHRTILNGRAVYTDMPEKDVGFFFSFFRFII